MKVKGFLVCVLQIIAGATPLLEQEQLMTDAELFAFSNGDQVRAALQRMLVSLSSELVDPIMTFPFDQRLLLDELVVQASQEFVADIEELSVLARQLEKRIKRAISKAISCSEVFHQWRRSVGFLAANMVNESRVNVSTEVRGTGIAMIEVFVKFVKIWSLVSSGFIANKQLRVLSSVPGLLISSSAAVSAGEVSSSSSFLEEMLKHEHRRKSCAFCYAAHKQPPSDPQASVSMLSETLKCTNLTKRLNCSKFYAHVVQIIDMLLLKGAGTSLVQNFCSESAENLLMYLKKCFGPKGLSTVQVASKLGNLCRSSLSLRSRIETIPSMLGASLTPPVYEDDDEIQETEIFLTTSSDIVEQTFHQLSRMNRFSFEQPLEISFADSPAVGSGTRHEWVSNFLRAITLPRYGFFEYSDERQIFLKPAPLNGDETNLLIKYRTIGRVLGISLKDQISPGISFTPGAASFLISDEQEDGRTAGALGKFLKIENPGKFSSLTQLRKTYLPATGHLHAELIGPPPSIESLGLTFDGTAENPPVVSVSDLEAYITQMTEKVVFESIRPQMTQIRNGIYEVIPYGHLSFLTVDEVTTLFRGPLEIQLHELRAATSYTPPESDYNRSVYTWIWRIIEAFSEEQKQDLLRFVSGSPFVPVHGFAGLNGDRKWMQISLEEGLPIDSLPRAQICFTQLRLPRYTSLEIMRERLSFAIANAKSLEDN